MIEKKKVGFILPEEMNALLDELAADLGRKERWVALSAAIVALAAMGEAERHELFGEVKSVDRPGGSYQPLIRWAKTGVMFQDLKREIAGQAKEKR